MKPIKTFPEEIPTPHRVSAARPYTARTRLAHTLAHNPPAYDEGYDNAPLHDQMRRMTADLILAGAPERWPEIAREIREAGEIESSLELHLRGAAMIYAVEPDWVSARRFLEMALELRLVEGDARLQASTLIDLAEIAVGQCDFESAWALLERARALDPTSGIVHVNRKTVAEAARNEGWMIDARQRLNEALPNWKSDAVLADQMDSLAVHLVSLL